MAGSPIATTEDEAAGLTAPEHHQRSENPLFPFKNEADYALAYWFHETGCTKGDVNRFFQDNRLTYFRVQRNCRGQYD